MREQVAAIAGAVGEPVRLEEVDVDTYRAQLLTQLPGPIVERFLQARGSVPPPPAARRTGHRRGARDPGPPRADVPRVGPRHAADFR